MENKEQRPQPQPQPQPSRPYYEHGNYTYGERSQPDGRASSSGTANPPPKKGK